MDKNKLNNTLKLYRNEGRDGSIWATTATDKIWIAE
jgi:hypothetical protein